MERSLQTDLSEIEIKQVLEDFDFDTERVLRPKPPKVEGEAPKTKRIVKKKDPVAVAETKGGAAKTTGVLVAGYTFGTPTFLENSGTPNDGIVTIPAGLNVVTVGFTNQSSGSLNRLGRTRRHRRRRT